MSTLLHRHEKKMEFSKIGHDLSLDFVKGIAILLVLLNHCTASAFQQDSWFFLWGYPAVPLFLLIQIFHAYKGGFGKKSVRWGKIWTRAMSPFLIAEVVILVATVAMYPLEPIRHLLLSMAYWGGGGPGSYYPWIYFQFAILLPLLAPLFRKLSEKSLLVLFLSLSIGSEVFCNLAHIPEWLYRLLFVRYIFLIYLGYQMVVRGVVLNILTLSLSLLSVVALYFFEVKDFRLFPVFYYSESWKSFHWLCYFYIAYPMLYVLCRFFYWLPADNWLEKTVCKMGEHSYAIYIFQLFYFVVIAPVINNLFSQIEATSLATVLFVFLSLLFCTIPVLRFVHGRSNMIILKKVAVWVLILSAGIALIGWKWRPFYQPAHSIAPYHVKQHQDDTLRVIMIGDSWVYFHQTLRRDSTFEEELKRVMGNRKVKVVAKGKGGATSGEIYQRMSNERTMEMDYELNNSTQPVIEAGADYCVISAGINDARQRRGRDYYVINCERIIRLLLSYGIRPVMLEIPDVSIDDAYDGNSLYYKIRARLMMGLLATDLRGVNGYRRPLKDSLIAHHLMDSIIYISSASWNPDGYRDKRNIYTDDGFHLTLPGYALLDSAFASEIVKDYRARH